MPRAAYEIGAVEKQVGLSRMGPALLSLCAAAEWQRSA
jgi:two-component system, chemotaxis family, protein-glutamate methylesterase/glutaminase